MTNRTYLHDSFVFTARDIDVIEALWREWIAGGTPGQTGKSRPSAKLRLRISSQVQIWALAWMLLERDEAYPQRVNFHPQCGSRAYLASFKPTDLPVEVLWRLIRPMLREDGTAEYSITSHKGWHALNVWPQGHRYHTDADLTEMEDLLLKLANRHYIDFQMGGRVWKIYTRPEEERL